MVKTIYIFRLHPDTHTDIARMGGIARKKKLSAVRRKEIASKAASARWEKIKNNKK